jgi:hypothetical protein
MMYAKEIVYDPETRDFAMYLGTEGRPDSFELVGFARTYADAETTLDELVYSLLQREALADEAPTQQPAA